MTRMLPGAALALATVTLAWAAEPPALTSQQQRLGYTIGLQIGQSLKGDGLEVDVDAMALGVKDFLAGREPRLSEEDRRATLQALAEEQQRRRASSAEENAAAGARFLAENKARDGVVTLASGLQYKVIKAGTGKQPTASDTVLAHYRGTLIDGTEFDSSFRRGQPATFPVNGVIRGWQEALPLMKEGARWEVYIPADLAYGPRGAGESIGPNQTLIFEIELIKVQ